MKISSKISTNNNIIYAKNINLYGNAKKNPEINSGYKIIRCVRRIVG
jgi:hypothetical protein